MKETGGTASFGDFLPESPTLLCLGAHSDDVEIGCGGTLLKLREIRPHAHVHWVVFTSTPEREAEARASAADFAQGFASLTIEIHAFRDGFLPQAWTAVKEAFEVLKEKLDPDLVLTHTRDDAHQDHRTVCELTWNTFRRHLVLEYEIPKWDGDLGRPNAYVGFDRAVLDRKIALLLKHFATQGNKDWFTEDLFSALPRIRGMECRAPYAEAFHARKIRLV